MVFYDYCNSFVLTLIYSSGRLYCYFSLLTFPITSNLHLSSHLNEYLGPYDCPLK